MYEERTVGKDYWVVVVSREGSDDRSYRITIPKKLGDKYGFDKYVKVEEHPTEEALIIRKV